MSDIDKLRALIEAQWQCDAYHDDGCECAEEDRGALLALAPELVAVVEAAMDARDEMEELGAAMAHMSACVDDLKAKLAKVVL